MLKQIYVKDFILFEEIEMEFDRAFSVFCGETGAGKSLLIDAISALLGGRVNGTLVKNGKPKAVIEGVFEIESKAVQALLEEAGIAFEEDLIITREINSDGKSTARINHRVVTASLLKQLGTLLVDIHSQHDNQYLLNQRYHLQLLDQYAALQEQRNAVRKAYQDYQREQQKLEDALHTTYNEDDLEFLRFQIDEIEKVALDEEAYDALLAEEKHWLSFEKRATHLKHALAYFDDGAMSALYEGCKALDGMDDEIVEKIQTALYDGYYALEEAISDLHRYDEGMEYDEARFNEVQEQLFELHKVMRKSGGTLLSMMQKKQMMEERVEQITHRQAFLDEQQAKVDACKKTYFALAEKLSKQRKAKAKELEQAILVQLRDLYLEHARFTIAFEETMQADGIDQVSFLISMNPGAKPAPLAKVASGGELSRFMLGMKVIFTALAGIDTVIFDEIDTGVSGRVALALGSKMSAVAKRSQVFAVTHLAQVAAYGDTQYLVEKQIEAHATLTKIKKLERQERIETLGYMATGTTSESSAHAASELFEQVHKEKTNAE